MDIKEEFKKSGKNLYDFIYDRIGSSVTPSDYYHDAKEALKNDTEFLEEALKGGDIYKLPKDFVEGTYLEFSIDKVDYDEMSKMLESESEISRYEYLRGKDSDFARHEISQYYLDIEKTPYSTIQQVPKYILLNNPGIALEAIVSVEQAEAKLIIGKLPPELLKDSLIADKVENLVGKDNNIEVEDKVENSSTQIIEEKSEKKKSPKQQLYEEYYKRRAVLVGKSHEFDDQLPESISKEIENINHILDALKTGNVWGEVETSDGVKIDKFVLEKYEKALDELTALRSENVKYVSKEDEENYQFKTVDYDKFEKQIQAFKDKTDLRAANNDIVQLMSSKEISLEDRQKLNQLQEKMFIESQDLPEHAESAKTEVVVKQSKFAEIYGKAKGKIKETFEKLKAILSKDHDKTESKDENETDER